MLLRSLGLGTQIAILVILSLISSGCASYAVPGKGADLSLFTDVAIDEDIGAILEREPAAVFPATVAVVRVQESDYRSWSVQRAQGSGLYSIVTTRELAEEEALERLAGMPLVRAMVPFNALLVPQRLEGDEELRAAAARLKADMLLIYTVDTSFRVEERAEPLHVLSLGILAPEKVFLTSTATAILLDTRTGFLYATAENTSRREHWSSSWTSRSKVDRGRIETETEAFQGLVGEVERAWTGVLANVLTDEVQRREAAAILPEEFAAE